MKALLTFILFVALTSCKSQVNNSKQCDENAFFSSSIGNDSIDESGQNYIFSFYSFINSSDYKRAYDIVNTKVPLSKDSLRKYSNAGTINVPIAKEVLFIAYRLSEYLGDVPEKTLLDDILTIHTLKESDSNFCFNKLVEIEYDYLSFFSVYDSLSKENQLQKVEKHVKEFPQSLRIKYLYGKLNYKIGKYNVALPVFYELLKKRYYEIPIFNYLFEYHKSNSDSLAYYAALFAKRFPLSCNLGKLFNVLNNGKLNFFFDECDKCLNGASKSDSVKGTVILSWYYLKIRKYEDVQRLYDTYQKNNTEFVFDSLKLWEAGEYFDIVLRSLFLQKKYRRMYEFLIKEVGSNSKVNVSTNIDFYQLIETYYGDYYNKEKMGLDNFYRTNFYWVPAYFKG